ncbi:uncharacterized protein MONOS_955 [Monocercomonoides exilis]|uniref:uncharacterized protein n=1 Tax=Monocercomonoides exilis TaxID=2049356 RepID=UPI00355A81C7|nr:hypothetical protein MONOS_955 [Monocercomonoides exilis]|eukprot:MONOS_955.1-p1 / transcript=MONOS_955.1 / gene=MONOS_955 / organism=Monocercomonoides_exilis_PA203 / gene_product=unspecified product / transcript_product=unspecified product / location=Mono_scaffold00016:6750-30422(-) / protein_length=7750 / sequence_SO=supercontig / SO=protein_coding / is_pseudo=false
MCSTSYSEKRQRYLTFTSSNARSNRDYTVTQTTASFNGDTFTRCTSSSNGGGISCITDNEQMKVEECTFTNCSTTGTGMGGSIYTEYSGAGSCIRKCSFTNSKSVSDGSAIAVHSQKGDFSISNCSIITCSSTNGRGAIFIEMVEDNPSIQMTVSSCSFIRNTASSGSSDLCYNGAQRRLSILSGSSASYSVSDIPHCWISGSISNTQIPFPSGPEIYVNKDTGEDWNNCGFLEEYPCKTVAYAVQIWNETYRAKPIFVVDGNYSESEFAVESKTINIKGNGPDKLFITSKTAQRLGSVKIGSLTLQLMKLLRSAASVPMFAVGESNSSVLSIINCQIVSALTSSQFDYPFFQLLNGTTSITSTTVEEVVMTNTAFIVCSNANLSLYSCNFQHISRQMGDGSTVEMTMTSYSGSFEIDNCSFSSLSSANGNGGALSVVIDHTYTADSMGAFRVAKSSPVSFESCGVPTMESGRKMGGAIAITLGTNAKNFKLFQQTRFTSCSAWKGTNLFVKAPILRSVINHDSIQFVTDETNDAWISLMIGVEDNNETIQIPLIYYFRSLPDEPIYVAANGTDTSACGLLDRCCETIGGVARLRLASSPRTIKVLDSFRFRRVLKLEGYSFSIEPNDPSVVFPFFLDTFTTSQTAPFMCRVSCAISKFHLTIPAQLATCSAAFECANNAELNLTTIEFIPNTGVTQVDYTLILVSRGKLNVDETKLPKVKFLNVPIVSTEGTSSSAVINNAAIDETISTTLEEDGLFVSRSFGILTIRNTNFSNQNNVKHSMMCGDSASLNAENCSFTSISRSSGNGSAVTLEYTSDPSYIYDNKDSLFRNCTFSSCSVSGEKGAGGACFIFIQSDHKFNFDTCSFTQTSAPSDEASSGKGGGIYLRTLKDSPQTCSLNSLTFTSCTAYLGPKLFFEGKNLSALVSNNTFRFAHGLIGPPEDMVSMVGYEDGKFDFLIPLVLYLRDLTNEDFARVGKGDTCKDFSMCGFADYPCRSFKGAGELRFRNKGAKISLLDEFSFCEEELLRYNQYEVYVETQGIARDVENPTYNGSNQNKLIQVQNRVKFENITFNLLPELNTSCIFSLSSSSAVLNFNACEIQIVGHEQELNYSLFNVEAGTLQLSSMAIPPLTFKLSNNRLTNCVTFIIMSGSGSVVIDDYTLDDYFHTDGAPGIITSSSSGSLSFNKVIFSSHNLSQHALVQSTSLGGLNVNNCSFRQIETENTNGSVFSLISQSSSYALVQFSISDSIFENCSSHVAGAKGGAGYFSLGRNAQLIVSNASFANCFVPPDSNNLCFGKAFYVTDGGISDTVQLNDLTFTEDTTVNGSYFFIESPNLGRFTSPAKFSFTFDKYHITNMCGYENGNTSFLIPLECYFWPQIMTETFVYIGTENGHDFSGCGNVTYPCETIAGAKTWRSSTNSLLSACLIPWCFSFKDEILFNVDRYFIYVESKGTAINVTDPSPRAAQPRGFLIIQKITSFENITFAFNPTLRYHQTFFLCESSSLTLTDCAMSSRSPGASNADGSSSSFGFSFATAKGGTITLNNFVLQHTTFSSSFLVSSGIQSELSLNEVELMDVRSTDASLFLAESSGRLSVQNSKFHKVSSSTTQILAATNGEVTIYGSVFEWLSFIGTTLMTIESSNISCSRSTFKYIRSMDVDGSVYSHITSNAASTTHSFTQNTFVYCAATSDQHNGGVFSSILASSMKITIESNNFTYCIVPNSDGILFPLDVPDPESNLVSIAPAGIGKGGVAYFYADQDEYEFVLSNNTYTTCKALVAPILFLDANNLTEMLFGNNKLKEITSSQYFETSTLTNYLGYESRNTSVPIPLAAFLRPRPSPAYVSGWDNEYNFHESSPVFSGGHDFSACGHTDYPCASLSYAVELLFSESARNIVLDGTFFSFDEEYHFADFEYSVTARTPDMEIAIFADVPNPDRHLSLLQVEISSTFSNMAFKFPIECTFGELFTIQNSTAILTLSDISVSMVDANAGTKMYLLSVETGKACINDMTIQNWLGWTIIHAGNEGVIEISNSVFIDCEGLYDQGLIFIISGGTLKCNQVTFSSLSTDDTRVGNEGPLLFFGGSILQMEDCHFDNLIFEDASAFMIDQIMELTMNRTTFTSITRRKKNGACLHIENNCETTILQSSHRSSTLSKFSNSDSSSQHPMKITDCTFTLCSVIENDAEGGAVYAELNDHSPLTFTNSSFENCYAPTEDTSIRTEPFTNDSLHPSLLGKGGGVSLLLKNVTSPYVFDVPNANWQDNQADIGRNIFVLSPDLLQTSTLVAFPNFVFDEWWHKEIVGSQRVEPEVYIPIKYLLQDPTIPLHVFFDGADNIGCGFDEYACKTLSYALNHQRIASTNRPSVILNQRLDMEEQIILDTSYESFTLSPETETPKPALLVNATRIFVSLFQVETVCTFNGISFILPVTMEQKGALENVITQSGSTLTFSSCMIQSTDSTQQIQISLVVVHGGEAVFEDLSFSASLHPSLMTSRLTNAPWISGTASSPALTFGKSLAIVFETRNLNVINDSGSITLKNSIVSDAIFDSSSIVESTNSLKVSVLNSTFSSITRAEGNGSCVWCQCGVTVSSSSNEIEPAVYVDGCTFKRCRVTETKSGGGAVYFEIGQQSSIDVVNTSFEECKAPITEGIVYDPTDQRSDSAKGYTQFGKGGGVFLYVVNESPNFSINTDNFTANEADFGVNVFVSAPLLNKEFVETHFPLLQARATDENFRSMAGYSNRNEDEHIPLVLYLLALEDYVYLSNLGSDTDFCGLQQFHCQTINFALTRFDWTWYHEGDPKILVIGNDVNATNELTLENDDFEFRSIDGTEPHSSSITVNELSLRDETTGKTREQLTLGHHSLKLNSSTFTSIGTTGDGSIFKMGSDSLMNLTNSSSRVPTPSEYLCEVNVFDCTFSGCNSVNVEAKGGTFCELLQSGMAKMSINNSTFSQCTCPSNVGDDEKGKGGGIYLFLDEKDADWEIGPVMTFTENDARWGKNIFIVSEDLNISMNATHRISFYDRDADEHENQIMMGYDQFDPSDAIDLYLYYSAFPETVHLDNDLGSDRHICGREEFPCKTLKKAIDQFLYFENVINICVDYSFLISDEMTISAPEYIVREGIVVNGANNDSMMTMIDRLSLRSHSCVLINTTTKFSSLRFRVLNDLITYKALFTLNGTESTILSFIDCVIASQSRNSIQYPFSMTLSGTLYVKNIILCETTPTASLSSSSSFSSFPSDSFASNRLTRKRASNVALSNTPFLVCDGNKALGEFQEIIWNNERATGTASTFKCTNGGRATLQNCNFNNLNYSSGSLIQLDSRFNLTVSNNTFENISLSDGSLIIVNGKNFLKLSNCTFSAISSNGIRFGCALSIINSMSTASQLQNGAYDMQSNRENAWSKHTVSKNEEEEDYNVIVTNCTFTNCHVKRSQQNGGSMSAQLNTGSSLLINSTSFSECSTAVELTNETNDNRHGGSLWIEMKGEAQSLVQNTSFSSCSVPFEAETATGKGGAVCIYMVNTMPQWSFKSTTFPVLGDSLQNNAMFGRDVFVNSGNLTESLNNDSFDSVLLDNYWFDHSSLEGFDNFSAPAIPLSYYIIPFPHKEVNEGETVISVPVGYVFDDGIDTSACGFVNYTCRSLGWMEERIHNTALSDKACVIVNGTLTFEEDVDNIFASLYIGRDPLRESCFFIIKDSVGGSRPGVINNEALLSITNISLCVPSVLLTHEAVFVYSNGETSITQVCLVPTAENSSIGCVLFVITGGTFCVSSLNIVPVMPYVSEEVSTSDVSVSDLPSIVISSSLLKVSQSSIAEITSMTLQNTKFSSLSVEDNAIFVAKSSSSLSISESTITSLTSSISVIKSVQSSISILQSTFSNMQNLTSPIVEIEDGTQVEINETTFSDLNLISCAVLSFNKANLPVTISNSTFTNISRQSSDGSCISFGKIITTNNGLRNEGSCDLTECSIDDTKPLILVESCDFDNCKIENSTDSPLSDGNGGCLFIQITNEVTAVVNNSNFSSCSAPYQENDTGKGGALYLFLSDPDVNWMIVNPTFPVLGDSTQNSASMGRDLFVSSNSLLISIICCRLPFVDLEAEEHDHTALIGFDSHKEPAISLIFYLMNKQGKPLHVSANGEDTTSCGFEEYHCQSISYSIQLAEEEVSISIIIHSTVYISCPLNERKLNKVNSSENKAQFVVNQTLVQTIPCSSEGEAEPSSTGFIEVSHTLQFQNISFCLPFSLTTQTSFFAQIGGYLTINKADLIPTDPSNGIGYPFLVSTEGGVDISEFEIKPCAFAPILLPESLNDDSDAILRPIKFQNTQFIVASSNATRVILRSILFTETVVVGEKSIIEISDQASLMFSDSNFTSLTEYFASIVKFNGGTLQLNNMIFNNHSRSGTSPVFDLASQSSLTWSHVNISTIVMDGSSIVTVEEGFLSWTDVNITDIISHSNKMISASNGILSIVSGFYTDLRMNESFISTSEVTLTVSDSTFASTISEGNNFFDCTKGSLSMKNCIFSTGTTDYLLVASSLQTSLILDTVLFNENEIRNASLISISKCDVTEIKNISIPQFHSNESSAISFIVTVQGKVTLSNSTFMSISHSGLKGGCISLDVQISEDGRNQEISHQSISIEKCTFDNCIIESRSGVQNTSGAAVFMQLKGSTQLKISNSSFQKCEVSDSPEDSGYGGAICLSFQDDSPDSEISWCISSQSFPLIGSSTFDETKNKATFGRDLFLFSSALFEAVTHSSLPYLSNNPEDYAADDSFDHSSLQGVDLSNLSVIVPLPFIFLPFHVEPGTDPEVPIVYLNSEGIDTRACGFVQYQCQSLHWASLHRCLSSKMIVSVDSHTVLTEEFAYEREGLAIRGIGEQNYFEIDVNRKDSQLGVIGNSHSLSITKLDLCIPSSLSSMHECLLLATDGYTAISSSSIIPKESDSSFNYPLFIAVGGQISIEDFNIIPTIPFSDLRATDILSASSLVSHSNQEVEQSPISINNTSVIILNGTSNVSINNLNIRMAIVSADAPSLLKQNSANLTVSSCLIDGFVNSCSTLLDAVEASTSIINTSISNINFYSSAIKSISHPVLALSLSNFTNVSLSSGDGGCIAFDCRADEASSEDDAESSININQCNFLSGAISSSTEEADGRGGSLFIYSSETVECLITSCTFRKCSAPFEGDTAKGYGGAIYLHMELASTNWKISNPVFPVLGDEDQNNAIFGRDVFISSSSLNETITNDTLPFVSPEYPLGYYFDHSSLEGYNEHNSAYSIPLVYYLLNKHSTIYVSIEGVDTTACGFNEYHCHTLSWALWRQSKANRDATINKTMEFKEELEFSDKTFILTSNDTESNSEMIISEDAANEKNNFFTLSAQCTFNRISFIFGSDVKTHKSLIDHSSQTLTLSYCSLYPFPDTHAINCSFISASGGSVILSHFSLEADSNQDIISSSPFVSKRCIANDEPILSINCTLFALTSASASIFFSSATFGKISVSGDDPLISVCPGATLRMTENSIIEEYSSGHSSFVACDEGSSVNLTSFEVHKSSIADLPFISISKPLNFITFGSRFQNISKESKNGGCICIKGGEDDIVLTCDANNQLIQIHNCTFESCEVSQFASTHRSGNFDSELTDDFVRGGAIFAEISCGVQLEMDDLCCFSCKLPVSSLSNEDECVIKPLSIGGGISLFLNNADVDWRLARLECEPKTGLRANKAMYGRDLFVDSSSLLTTITEDRLQITYIEIHKEDISSMQGFDSRDACLALPLVFLLIPLGTDVFVSNSDGRDVVMCGFQSYTCKTLNYALNRQNNVIIGRVKVIKDIIITDQWDIDRATLVIDGTPIVVDDEGEDTDSELVAFSNSKAISSLPESQQIEQELIYSSWTFVPLSSSSNQLQIGFFESSKRVTISSFKMFLPQTTGGPECFFYQKGGSFQLSICKVQFLAESQPSLNVAFIKSISGDLNINNFVVTHDSAAEALVSFIELSGEGTTFSLSNYVITNITSTNEPLTRNSEETSEGAVANACSFLNANKVQAITLKNGTFSSIQLSTSPMLQIVGVIQISLDSVSFTDITRRGGKGGSLFADQTSLTISQTYLKNCNFTRCSVSNEPLTEIEGMGGGICFLSVKRSRLRIDGCTFSECSAPFGSNENGLGGGLYVSVSSPDGGCDWMVSNPTFYSLDNPLANTAKYGRDIFITSAALNNTIKNESMPFIAPIYPDSYYFDHSSFCGFDQHNPSFSVPIVYYLLDQHPTLYVTSDGVDTTACGYNEYCCQTLPWSIKRQVSNSKDITINKTLELDEEISFSVEINLRSNSSTEQSELIVVNDDTHLQEGVFNNAKSLTTTHISFVVSSLQFHQTLIDQNGQFLNMSATVLVLTPATQSISFHILRATSGTAIVTDFMICTANDTGSSISNDDSAPLKYFTELFCAFNEGTILEINQFTLHSCVQDLSIPNIPLISGTSKSQLHLNSLSFKHIALNNQAVISSSATTDMSITSSVFENIERKNGLGGCLSMLTETTIDSAFSISNCSFSSSSVRKYSSAKSSNLPESNLNSVSKKSRKENSHFSHSKSGFTSDDNCGGAIFVQISAYTTWRADESNFTSCTAPYEANTNGKGGAICVQVDVDTSDFLIHTPHFSENQAELGYNIFICAPVLPNIVNQNTLPFVNLTDFPPDNAMMGYDELNETFPVPLRWYLMPISEWIWVSLTGWNMRVCGFSFMACQSLEYAVQRQRGAERKIYICEEGELRGEMLLDVYKHVITAENVESNALSISSRENESSDRSISKAVVKITNISGVESSMVSIKAETEIHYINFVIGQSLGYHNALFQIQGKSLLLNECALTHSLHEEGIVDYFSFSIAHLTNGTMRIKEFSQTNIRYQNSLFLVEGETTAIFERVQLNMLTSVESSLFNCTTATKNASVSFLNCSFEDLSVLDESSPSFLITRGPKIVMKNVIVENCTSSLSKGSIAAIYFSQVVWQNVSLLEPNIAEGVAFNEEYDEICSWGSSLVHFENSTGSIENSSIKTEMSGGISLIEANIILNDVNFSTFNSMTAQHQLFPSAARDILCEEGSELGIAKSAQETLDEWIYASGCKLKGIANQNQGFVFMPTIHSFQHVISRDPDTYSLFEFKGEKLIPCNISVVLYITWQNETEEELMRLDNTTNYVNETFLEVNVPVELINSSFQSSVSNFDVTFIKAVRLSFELRNPLNETWQTTKFVLANYSKDDPGPTPGPGPDPVPNPDPITKSSDANVLTVGMIVAIALGAATLLICIIAIIICVVICRRNTEDDETVKQEKKQVISDNEKAQDSKTISSEMDSSTANLLPLTKQQYEQQEDKERELGSSDDYNSTMGNDIEMEMLSSTINETSTSLTDSSLRKRKKKKRSSKQVGYNLSSNLSNHKTGESLSDSTESEYSTWDDPAPESKQDSIIGGITYPYREGREGIEIRPEEYLDDAFAEQNELNGFDPIYEVDGMESESKFINGIGEFDPVKEVEGVQLVVHPMNAFGIMDDPMISTTEKKKKKKKKKKGKKGKRSKRLRKPLRETSDSDYTEESSRNEESMSMFSFSTHQSKDWDADGYESVRIDDIPLENIDNEEFVKPDLNDQMIEGYPDEMMRNTAKGRRRKSKQQNNFDNTNEITQIMPTVDMRAPSRMTVSTYFSTNADGDDQTYRPTSSRNSRNEQEEQFEAQNNSVSANPLYFRNSSDIEKQDSGKNSSELFEEQSDRQSDIEQDPSGDENLFDDVKSNDSDNSSKTDSLDDNLEIELAVMEAEQDRLMDQIIQNDGIDVFTKIFI